jgi:hypothetical protein
LVVSANSASISNTLSQWLRLLWGITPQLHLNSDVPHIAAGAIHLPARNHWRLHMASAAHTAAHLAYSPCVFDGGGIGPIVRSLMGLLEDARIEALAICELPGLSRLWRPLHDASPEIGTDFESLMRRLARSLADPAYDDPDRWVRKGVALFYANTQRLLPILRTPADIRRVAMQLGHDIGQLRLQFNAKSYRPFPAYRDDNRWMWAADNLNAAPPPAVVAGTLRNDDEPPPVASATVTRFPEWDRLISRLRPDWSSVIEQRAPTITIARATAADDEFRQVAVQLRNSLRMLSRTLTEPQRSDEGDFFDPGALVDWRVARRLRDATEMRVYRALNRCATRAAVYVLIDQSASTSIAHSAGRTVLQTAALAACAMSAALHNVGVDCTIAGFCSYGRHAVRLATVKSFDERADDITVARLRALQPGGSTRLGAAIRHASSRLAEQCEGPRWVLVLSDGEPHDVDVHDPRYLIEDARRAVLAAGRLGVRVVCLVMAPDRASIARRIFGRPGVQPLRDLGDMARVLPRLMA